MARDVRSRPEPEPPVEDVRPEVAEARAAVEEIRKSAGELGELILEIAPAYQSDADVADVVGIFADEIGMSLEEALAYWRYAITGDRRCLDLIL